MSLISLSKKIPLDTIRIILIVALVILCLNLYKKWQDHSESLSLTQARDASRLEFESADTAGTTDTAPTEAISSTATDTPTEETFTDIAPIPTSEADLDVPQASLPEAVAPRPTLNPSATHKPLRLRTELIDIAISPIGGQLVGASLRQHLIDRKKPDQGYHLLSELDDDYSVLQSGLIDGAGSVLNHRELYQMPVSVPTPNSDGIITVPLSWQNDKLRVTKQWLIDLGSYVFEEKYTITNLSTQTLRMRLYSQINSKARLAETSLISSYFGGGYFAADKGYRKLDYDTFESEPLSLDVIGGWLAMIEHYFIVALVPPTEQSWHYYSKRKASASGPRHLIGMYGPPIQVNPQDKTTVGMKYFLGPKQHENLALAHPELNQTIDYGILSFLSKPMFWVLDFFHGWTNNWGWAIVLLTMVVRLILYKPSEISFRSMARMREATPEIQRIRSQYKDSREQMGTKMMEIYRKRKINPLSGCLPILLQIPVFIALYWMLLESVELRHAPWVLWIEDLSEPDPWYILPIVMGSFMIVQQKLNPAPLDPIQQKVFAAMPIMMGGFSLFFPAGLVLYWSVNNILSILQQWVINKRIHEQAVNRRHN